MYLDPAAQKAAGEFLNGLLWPEIKRCLLARRPKAADVKDNRTVAAAKGHCRSAFESAIEEIEKLPFEHDPDGIPRAFDRPAVTITED